MDVTFYGVRGSCPCPSANFMRYGGNTACAVLGVDGEQSIILDAGTGLRSLAACLPLDGTFRGIALLTHLHWDHVQGLPFFPPADRPGARFDIYGPEQDGASLAEVFDQVMRPPYFPVRVAELRGEIVFHGVSTDDLSIGNAKVRVRPVPHLGPTVGYRVEWGGASLAYISDHQAPPGLASVAETVLDLADGVDVLIHDAQYRADEYPSKATWGHCTVDYALLVAREAGARRLVLFHHDPAHDDDELDVMVAAIRRVARGTGVEEVIAATEGLRLTL